MNPSWDRSIAWNARGPCFWNCHHSFALKWTLYQAAREWNVHRETLAKGLAGRPLSDVAYVIREGARLAARSRKSCLDNDSMVAALASTPARDRGAAQGRIGFV